MSFSAWIFLGVALSIFAGLCGGLLSAWATFRASEQRADFEKQLADQSKEISKKSTEIANKNAEIAELNKQIAATLTGGDNYSYVQISPPKQNSHLCEVYLINPGDYPVYDVSVEITDVKRLLELSHVAPPTGSQTEMGQYLAQAVTTYPTRNIGPKKSLPLGMLQFPDSDTEQYKAYNVQITARNGWVDQEIRLRRAGENGNMGTRGQYSVRAIAGPNAKN
jgi:hypothetical protein